MPSRSRAAFGICRGSYIASCTGGSAKRRARAIVDVGDGRREKYDFAPIATDTAERREQGDRAPRPRQHPPTRHTGACRAPIKLDQRRRCGPQTKLAPKEF